MWAEKWEDDDNSSIARAADEADWIINISYHFTPKLKR